MQSSLRYRLIFNYGAVQGQSLAFSKQSPFVQTHGSFEAPRFLPTTKCVPSRAHANARPRSRPTVTTLPKHRSFLINQMEIFSSDPLEILRLSLQQLQTHLCVCLNLLYKKTADLSGKAGVLCFTLFFLSDNYHTTSVPPNHNIYSQFPSHHRMLQHRPTTFCKHHNHHLSYVGAIA